METGNEEVKGQKGHKRFTGLLASLSVRQAKWVCEKAGTQGSRSPRDSLFALFSGYGQFTYGLNESMTGIVAARCGPAAA
eukprot:199012-Chlamydomonas_euryale.AAC.1